MAFNVISMCLTRSLRFIPRSNLINLRQSQLDIVSRRTIFGANTSNKTSEGKTTTSTPRASDETIIDEKELSSPEESSLIGEKEKALAEENKKLLELVKEIDDKYKRSLADGENTRIRMRKQVDEAKQFGIQGFCKDLLDVADVLNMAIEAVPKEEVKKGNQVLKNLFEGVVMTEQQMQSVLKRHGVSKVNPIGEKFNPNEHHAMFEADEPGKEPGTVAIVTKIGYKLHERTLRPAMVGVVKARKS